MADVTLFNTDRVPVHADSAGRVIGVGERGRGDLSDPVVATAVASGRLLVVDENDEPSAPAVDPEAVDQADDPDTSSTDGDSTASAPAESPKTKASRSRAGASTSTED